MIPFVWNSMMSWAGGWFFLMASEQFTLGSKDFRLPGLGSYLKAAADAGDLPALFLALLTLVVVIVLLDFFLWRPLVAWSGRFKMEQTEAAEAPSSPVLTALRRSAVRAWVEERVVVPAGASLDQRISRLLTPRGVDHAAGDPAQPLPRVGGHVLQVLLLLVVLVAVRRGAAGALTMLAQVGSAEWLLIAGGAGATLLRSCAALVLATAWTVPAGIAIGLNPSWSKRIQPLVQVVASIPATGIFPALLLVLLGLPGGLSLAAVALMLLGTQWYLLFNVIAGAMAIPTDLQEAAKIFKLSGWQRWRNLILPAIFPALVTGMITATGGAWNASIVAEYVTFRGVTHSAVGLGAVIAGAADTGNFPVLLAGTLVMAAMVVTINWLLWHRLYGLAQERFRLE
jgi:NitT/TauT family transport system permease protein